MLEPFATKVVLDIRVMRSTKATACDICGLRRITYALVTEPLFQPLRWMCADCSGIRVPAHSEAAGARSGDPVLWPEDPADLVDEEVVAVQGLDGLIERLEAQS
jgi:hypothetical protein